MTLGKGERELPITHIYILELPMFLTVFILPIPPILFSQCHDIGHDIGLFLMTLGTGIGSLLLFY
jgi:hypothetical protein